MVGVEERTGLDLDYLAQEDRMHRRVYMDSGIFDLEMKYIFGGTWVYVGHESEIPTAGDFKTRYLGTAPVLFTRSEDGAVHVLYNRCMHRGALITREEGGQASSLSCLYHGWTYGMDGKCIAVGFQSGFGPELALDEWGLVEVARVESYRGFVFASQSAEVQSLEDYLGRSKFYIDKIIDSAPAQRITIHPRVMKYSYKGNWKFLLENWADAYHPAFAHQGIFGIFRRQGGPRSNIQGDDGSENVSFGNGHTMIDYSAAKEPLPTGGRVDPGHVAALAERVGQAEAERLAADGNMNLNIFPNLLFRTSSHGFQVIRPVRVDYTESWYYSYTYDGAPDDFNRSFFQSGARALDPVQTDDNEAYERIQEGLAIEQIEWMIYNRGLHREQDLGDMGNGEVRGRGSDELAHRAQHREWKRLMAIGIQSRT